MEIKYFIIIMEISFIIFNFDIVVFLKLERGLLVENCKY